jgi:RNA polymerase sigma factor (sigma-70 family)
VTASATHRAIEAVWRIESARLIAGLMRMVRDVGLAEELAQDALVAALEQWPESGVPDNPGAWLMAAAKHRAIDYFRRSERLERKREELGRELEARQEAAEPDLDAALDEDVGDDLLRLMFTCCHPVLSPEARVALTLRLLGGLTTEEIARAFLVPEPTVAQRIVRAKRTLTETRVPFEVPRGTELADRLSSVLEDRGRWDHILIRRGLAALERAEELGGALGPYTLQAAIAACHARARSPAETDWGRIAALYDALAQLSPSPVVELNRAVAVAMAFGPAEGLELADALTSEPLLDGYHLLPSVRGDLLEKLGRFDEAHEEFERAAALTRNTRERALLLERAAACARDAAPPQPRRR